MDNRHQDHTVSELYLNCHNFLYDPCLTSYPLLGSVSVHRFRWRLSGGSDPVCCSTLPWPWGAGTGGLECLCWGLSGRLACGCGASGFTVGRFLAELEPAGELFMLKWGQGEENVRDLSSVIQLCNIGTCQCVFTVLCGLTFRASSGTVSSPLTTVNRLVCEADTLRINWPQQHNDYICKYTLYTQMHETIYYCEL